MLAKWFLLERHYLHRGSVYPKFPPLFTPSGAILHYDVISTENRCTQIVSCYLHRLGVSIRFGDMCTEFGAPSYKHAIYTDYSKYDRL
jgi:hypothetical protein